MNLPENHAAYVIELSHLFADGATYYDVLNLLHRAVNSAPMPDLKWVPAPPNIIFPDCYSDEDRQIVGGGWIPGYEEKAAKYAPGTTNERVVDVRLVNKEAVAALKEEYGHTSPAKVRGVPFLSTNDLLTAAVAELADEGGQTWMYANMRGRAPGATHDLAGNYERAIHFPAALGANDPAFIRGLIGPEKFVYYGREGNPRVSSDKTREEVAKCNIHLISNWANLTHVMVPPGCKLIGHTAIVMSFPGFDFSVVFRADAEGTLGFLTNYVGGYRGQEPADRISNSKIFSRLFSAPTSPAMVASKQPQ